MRRLLAVAVLALALAACGGGGSKGSSSTLAKTADTCTDKPVIDSVRSQFKASSIVRGMAEKAGVTEDAEWALIADGIASLSADHTLVITGAGKQMKDSDTMYDEGILGLAIEACVLDGLGTPTAVREHISSTRALDGQQTDQWGKYSARWTYHPDAGQNMTITEG